MSIIQKNKWSPAIKILGRSVGSVVGLVDQIYAGGIIVGGILGGYQLGGSVGDKWVTPDTETKKMTTLSTTSTSDFYNDDKLKDRNVELGDLTAPTKSIHDSIFGAVDTVVGLANSFGVGNMVSGAIDKSFDVGNMVSGAIDKSGNGPKVGTGSFGKGSKFSDFGVKKSGGGIVGGGIVGGLLNNFDGLFDNKTYDDLMAAYDKKFNIMTEKKSVVDTSKTEFPEVQEPKENMSLDNVYSEIGKMLNLKYF